jgi:hypothetical protein
MLTRETANPATMPMSTITIAISMSVNARRREVVTVRNLRGDGRIVRCASSV